MTTLKTVQKAVRALLELSRVENHGVGVIELSNRLGYPKAVTHRLLTTLLEEGFVEQDLVTKKYSIGSRSFEVGIKYRSQDKLSSIAEPYLKSMMDRLDQTCSCYLGVLDDTDVVFLKAYYAPKPIKVGSAKQGDRRPAHTTALGKSILAALPAGELESLIVRLDLSPLTKNTITDEEYLRKEIKSNKLQGYSIADQESLEGVTAVGAAIFPSRLFLSAISVSIPSIMKTNELMTTLANAVRGTASDIEKAIREYLSFEGGD